MPDYKIVDAEKLDADLKYVADKIRAKSGTTEEMDFPLGYGEVVDSISKGENLDEEIFAQEALIVEIKEALVGKTIGGEPTPTQEKTVEIKVNGTMEILPDEGYALSKVITNVDVPIPEGYIKPSGTKEIAENGTYDVKEFESVNVAVASSSSSDKLAKVVERTATEITAEDLEGCTKIGQYAFQYYTKLENITIPDSVTSIGDQAFSGCTGLTSITIPDSITIISSYMLQNCEGLTSITIPDSVISIGNGAFRNCTGLTSITIPDSVKYIGNGSFNGCTGLTSVTIPYGVTNIGAQTFQNCTSMQYYDFTKCTTVPPLSYTNAFYNIPSTCEIRVPMALVDEWKAATNWSTYASQIVGV